MRNDVRLQVISSLGVAALDATMPLTGFAVTDFKESDEDSDTWGDPVED